ncbi:MAG: hypothetical protein R3F39_00785 [Myxococcota bacterium]
MTRTLRFFLVASALALASPPASAALTPRALLVDLDPVPAALLLPYGLLTRGDGGAPWLTCWQRFDTATYALATAGRRLLVGGPAGPWNTNDEGCRFESTDGAAEKRAVTGLYAPVAGALDVLIATDDGVSPSSVALSTDGGITTTQAGELSFADAGVLALLGEGDVVWAVTRDRQGGDLGVWRSEDRGLKAAAVSLGGGPAGGTAGLEAAAASADRLWFWQGDALVRLAVDGTWATTGLVVPGAPKAALATSDGALWVASPEAGLVRLAPDGATREVTPLPTSALAARGPRLWAAHVASAPGDPLVSSSGDLGETWSVSMVAPAEVGHPPLCTTLVSQRCAAEVATFRESLGLYAPVPDAAAEDAPTPSGGSGCVAASSPVGLLAALLGLLLYASASRRCRIRAAESCSPRSVATSSAVTRA